MPALKLLRRLMTRAVRPYKPATVRKPHRSLFRPIETLEDRITPVLTQNFDAVVAPALPAGWSATSTGPGGAAWVTSTTTSVSAPNSAFVNDPANISDAQLNSPVFTVVAGEQLSFQNNYNLESTYDGSVLEISINGGAFTDIIAAGGSFVSGGYTGTISTSFGNPIGGRSAWTGNSGGFVATTVNYPASAIGQSVQLRFRMGSDNSVAAVGWYIDNINSVAASPPPPGLALPFNEPFANNSNGWTLGSQWQIGPATPSSGQSVGFGDPAVDTTPTGDNGIAGIIIGGNASTAIYPYTYLTSPVLNASLSSGQILNLSFQRWLNSDYTPYMQNNIEVFNGSSWVEIWASGGPPEITDSAWSLQSFNITPHANPALQVRFGLRVQSGGAYTMSSWNIDDFSVTVTTPPPVYPIFTEPFANNSQGWTLGSQWQIGPATPSSGQSVGFGDPAVDTTPTGDNGIAGIIIGGNASTAIYPYTYLTSPVINAVPGPGGSLFLSFQRWLNSDYTPYMQNNIEVFNGSSWVEIWASGGPPEITENAWSLQAFNITPHANPALQVRFGLRVQSGGAYTMSSWNIDDFLIATDVPPPPTLDATVTGGNLIITDVSAGGIPNDLTAVLSGSNIVITSTVEKFIAAPAGGVLSNGDKTLTIPLAAFPGSITFNTAGGNDLLTISETGGVITRAVTYNGAAGNDVLTITGGTFATVAHAHTGAAAGTITMTGAGLITYGTLEAVNLTPTSIGTLTETLPAGPSVAVLQDDGTTGNGLTRLQSSPTSFPQTTFRSPTTGLTVNRGNAADTIRINGIPDLTSALTIGAAGTPFASITLNSGAPITTSGSQSYFGPVILSAETTLNAASVAFSSTVNSVPAISGRVAILSGDSPSGSDPDVVASITAAGGSAITGVDVFDVTTSTPSLATLSTYAAVIVYSNFPYFDAATLGTNLASYVNSGRGVVTAVFNNYISLPYTLGGNWMGGAYDPYAGTSLVFQTLAMGAVAQPSHPIMSGVSTLTNYYSLASTLTSNTSLIASYANGNPLAVEKTGFAGKIIGLNMMPVSSAFYGAQGWTGDGGKLMANALKYAGGLQSAVGLTVNSAGATTFGGVVGGTGPLTSLTTNAGGTTSINGNVTTTGPITLGDAVTLATTSTLTSTSAGAVTFGSTVNGPGGLTVNTAGVTAFNGLTGTVTPLASLTTDAPGSTVLTAGTVTSSGAVALNDPVVLGSSTVVNGASVTYGNTVNANSTFGAPYVVSTPAFNFIDISGTGTLGPTTDDTVVPNIPIGFNFTYFGVATNLVAVSPNGWMSATNNTAWSVWDPTGPLPNAGTPNGTIAGWWTDLYPPGGGSIRYQTVGAPGSRIFIVQWTGIPHYPSGNPVTFQIQMHEGTNRIEVHLPNAPSNGANHAIGVENGTGTVGTSGYFGTAALPANSAYRFSPTVVPNGATLTTNSTGATTFTGAVGGVTPLGALTTNAGTNLTLGAATTTTGTTTLNFGTAGTGGIANINGAITSGGAASLNGGAGADTANLNVSPVSALTVNGNAGNDTFNFGNGVTLSGGTLNGGADTDTVNYGAYSTPVAVNLGSMPGGGTLGASLNGLNEVPFNNNAATATATITNYNPLTKTFDISVTATNLAPATVTGFHIHRGAQGVNGPIIIDLQPLAPLVPAGTGFTFTVTGVSLATSLLGGVANEAAFLGGVTYLNIHTATFPAGVIRGQVYPTAAFAASAGTATGTAGISNVENATGGTANDSIVGTLGVNVLNGGAGNDTIVGGPGNDLMDGGTNDDVLVWSNGDGSDVMDGGAGTDIVQVNGATAAGDVFVIGSGAGGRVSFARTNLGVFSLDIGTTETLTVAGAGGDDAMTVNSLATVVGLTTLNLDGGDGNDTFNVLPAASTAINISGGNPITAPGDTLVLNASTLTAPIAITDPSGTPGSNALPHGRITAGNTQPVNWISIETLPVPLGLGGTFDFQTVASATQPGFLPVLRSDTPTTGSYASAEVGWVNPGMGTFDRFAQFGPAGNPNSPAMQTLFRDGQWGNSGGGANNGLFQVAVAPGALPSRLVQITAYVGDVFLNRDTMNIYVRNLTTGTRTKLNPNLAALNTASTSFQYVSYGGMIDPGAVATPGSTKVLLQIEVEAEFGGATAHWTISGVDVRPLGLIAPLTIAPASTPLTGDGITVDTYTGSGAAPGAELTVSAALGTVMGTDADPSLKGFQVLADANGIFSFSVRRPAGPGSSIISVTDVTGASGTGYLSPTSSDPGSVTPNPFLLPNPYTQVYTAPPVALAYDFNSGSSPTLAGFTSIQPTDVYSDRAGRGWQSPVTGYDRSGGGTPADLFRDGAFGTRTGTFQVKVNPGSYDVRVYVGDPYRAWSGITVSANGGAPIAVDSAANQFGYVTLYGVALLGDVLSVTMTAGSDGFWVASGIQIANAGGLPAPVTPAASTLTGVRRLDFNGGSADTIAGFTPGTGATYTPAVGYGWRGTVNTLERPATPVPIALTPTQYQMYRDAAWGQSTAAGVFQIAVPTGAANTYQARVYVGDSFTNWQGITLQMEGGSLVNVNTSANPFWSYLLNGNDANGDGILTITVTGSVWVVNGIEVTQTAGTASNVLPASIGPGAAPQLAAEGAVRSGVAPVITYDMLAPIVSQALTYWQAAGLSPAQMAMLNSVTFQIEDLGMGGHLGLTSLFGNVVRIDDDGVGRGWFVDATPAINEEYDTPVQDSLLVATNRKMTIQYDLLTVVMHELGHVIGLDSLYQMTSWLDLMHANLPVGIRRLPTAANVQSMPTLPSGIKGNPPIDPVAIVTPVRMLPAIPAASVDPVASSEPGRTATAAPAAPVDPIGLSEPERTEPTASVIPDIVPAIPVTPVDPEVVTSPERTEPAAPAGVRGQPNLWIDEPEEVLPFAVEEAEATEPASIAFLPPDIPVRSVGFSNGSEATPTVPQEVEEEMFLSGIVIG